ncbi:MAG TPA: flagellar hook-basal body complex protein FliE [Hyphomicrobiaceae bacterium]|jgi:flagellar hook-basal body complex protein FliE|nr:flagellar hook-basal body complex protein FliE [Hyphomicrobiaceae bacterium]
MNIDPIGAATPGSTAAAAENAVGAAGVGLPAAAGETGRADFASLLGQMMSSLAGALRTGEAASLAGLKGQLPVAGVVEAVMTAEQTLQGAIAVRDKVVAAYLELSRMQI